MKCNSEGGGGHETRIRVSVTVWVWRFMPFNSSSQRYLGLARWLPGAVSKEQNPLQPNLPPRLTYSSRNSQHQHPQLCKLPDSTKTPGRGPATYMIPPPRWLIPANVWEPLPNLGHSLSSAVFLSSFSHFVPSFHEPTFSRSPSPHRLKKFSTGARSYPWLGDKEHTVRWWKASHRVISHFSRSSD